MKIKSTSKPKDTYIEYELEKTRQLYEKYFKGSDISLKDLIRMRGCTLLMNNGCTDSALFFGLTTL